MPTYSDYFGVLTYIDPLIYFKPESHSNWAHREMSLKRDPFLKKYVCQLDAEIFQELPIFEPDILGSAGDEEEPEQTELSLVNVSKRKNEENKDVIKDWENEQYTALFTRMFDAARTHKWCIVQLYDDVPYWRVFTYREVKQIRYDGNDVPISADIVWAKQLPCAATVRWVPGVVNI